MKEITRLDISILKLQSDETLMEWYEKLNTWEWVSELSNEESIDNHHKGRRRALMNWITMVIGHKNLLRYHNRNEMTNEQFEMWWQTESMTPEILIAS